MAGRPPGAPNKDKPFRDALRMEIAALADDPKGLRGVARKLIDKAYDGDVQAIKELADRLDGKVAQGVIGGEDDDPAIQTVTRIELIGVRPSDTDS